MNFKYSHIVRYMALAASAAFLTLTLMAPSCLDKVPIFSHQNHVKVQKLECVDCHAGTADGIQVGPPDPETCAACHEEAEKFKGIAKQLAAKWPRYKALPPDGIFSHKKHEDAQVKCESCHRKIENSKKLTFAYMPTESVCLDCHRKRPGATECSTCHKSINTKAPPPDHSQDWERFHGDAARDPARGDRCYRCHERSVCASCHSVEKPLDHNNAWREMGHGAVSQMDRSRCAVCHRSDYCIRCHSETPPSNHRGGWGEPNNRHCAQCHLTGGSQNCSVCHGARISHSDAPRKPEGMPHDLATDCRSCHNGFLLPHPDSGDNCRVCHK